jgi:uncharacterized protein (DUF736 family)
MAIIGTFTKGDNGIFTGTIRTLGINAKIRIVPETDKTRDNAPDYRVFAQTFEVGAAWKKTAQESGRDYLSLKLDDPGFAQPIFASLFPAEDGEGFSLLWSRRTNG